MRLLLDLGNTRLKWARQDRSDAWLDHGAADWRDDVESVLASAWMALPAPAEVIGASVVDGEREARVAALARRVFGVTTTWVRTPAEACGVRVAYADPRRLGVDRFLGMVSARSTSSTPCVLVGIGTALTLDALTVDGQHLGGLIAPGPQLMQQSLFGATARIESATGEIVAFADNTADAVASGCWHAAAALVERFVAQTATRLGTVPELVLGGGDAATLLPLLSLPARLSQDAVLRGLAIWADTP